MRIVRTCVDTDGCGDVLQVGAAVLVDGERLSEVWIAAGPFDSVDEALMCALDEANALADGQLRGQLRLLT